MMQRRAVIRFFLAFIAWGAFGRKASAGAVTADATRMAALAGAVLPLEIGLAGRELAAHQFMDWLRDYRADVELDHEYGTSTLRRTPPSPAHKYAAQLEDLDRRCGGHFAAASLAGQQRAITAALLAAGVKDLPGRPDGAHVATDLMAHFFNGPVASDLAYGRSIGRFDCRGLQNSEQRPPALGDK